MDHTLRELVCKDHNIKAEPMGEREALQAENDINSDWGVMSTVQRRKNELKL